MVRAASSAPRLLTAGPINDFTSLSTRSLSRAASLTGGGEVFYAGATTP